MSATLSYSDWLMSDAFQPVFKERHAIGSADAALMRVRIEETCPVPANKNVTVQLMRAGSMDYRGDYGAGRFAARMTPGQFGFTPHDTPLFNEGRGRMEFLVLSMSPDFVHSRWSETLDGRQPDMQRLHSELHRDQQVAAILPWLWAASGPDAPSGRLYADSAIDMLLCRIARLTDALPKPARGGLAPWQERRCTEYLRDNVGEDVDLSTLAAIANLSPFHFARMFRKSVGVPPHRYQILLRLERAKEMLVTSDMSIIQVALAVGYETPQALARLFQRELSMTPSAYRRERRL